MKPLKILWFPIFKSSPTIGAANISWNWPFSEKRQIDIRSSFNIFKTISLKQKCQGFFPLDSLIFFQTWLSFMLLLLFSSSSFFFISFPFSVFFSSSFLSFFFIYPSPFFISSLLLLPSFKLAFPTSSIVQ